MFKRMFGISEENSKQIYAFLGGFSLTFSIIQLVRGSYFIGGGFGITGIFYLYLWKKC